MILSKKVTITINPNNYKFYKNIISNIETNNTYDIDISYLNPKSHQKIEVECDICHSISKKPYREYLKSFNKRNVYCCSPKCALFKNKQTNLDKYGCENSFQSKSIMNKIKETNLKKYGVEYPSQNEKIRNKIKESVYIKYGVNNPAQSDIIKEKIKNTCLKKFDSENYTSSKYAKNKRIEKKLQVPDNLRSKFQIYLRMVRNKTNRLRKKVFEDWNGIDYYDNEYIRHYLNLKSTDKKYPTIDHKISIYQGFIEDIDPELIGDFENLCITKRSINSRKHIKCF
jgi:hypothetical protein